MSRCSIALLCAAALATACASTRTNTPGGVPIDTRFASVNQDSRALFLVIHYTVAGLRESIKVLTETPHEVSAHYLVSDDTPPVIYRLVPEERRAWHSGPSHWRGHQRERSRQSRSRETAGLIDEVRPVSALEPAPPVDDRVRRAPTSARAP